VFRGILYVTLVALATWLGTARAPEPKLRNATGSILHVVGDRLLVGGRDGTLASYKASDGSQEFSYPAAVGQPVSDVLWYSGRPWWVTQSSSIVRTVDLQEHTPVDFDLALAGFTGPVRKISAFLGYILCSGDENFVFIDPGTRTILKPDEVLPTKVVQRARMGSVVATWNGKEGTLLSIVRVAKKGDARAKDKALLTAWNASFDKKGKEQFQMLGGPVINFREFREGDGPRVEFKELEIGERAIDLPHAAADLRNILISAEGILIVEENEIHVIPVYAKNWIPAKLVPRAKAIDPQDAAVIAGNVWYRSGKQIHRVELEGGSVDVYAPRTNMSQVIDVAADATGLWVLSGDGVRHIGASNAELKDAGYVRYEVGPDSSKPKSRGAAKFKMALQQALRNPEKAKGVLAVVKTAGLKSIPAERASKTPANLEYADIVYTGGSPQIYVGDGQGLRYEGGKWVRGPINFVLGLRVLRLFTPDPRGVNFDKWDGGATPIGIGIAQMDLGHGVYVSIDPTSPYDKPFDAPRRKLQSMIDSWLGVPYKWAGSSYGGTDCSGLVQSIFRELGVNLPHHSQSIGSIRRGSYVQDQLQYGDVIVIREPNNHVAIYVGDGKLLEATPPAVQITGNLRAYTRGIVRRFL
jgi:hypothetical protein